MALQDAERRAQQRRARLAVGGLTAALLVITTFALLAFSQWQTANQRSVEAQASAEARAAAEADALAQRDRAESERRAAVARQLAAQALALRDERLDLALLLGLEAERLGGTDEVKRSLLAATIARPRLTMLARGKNLGAIGNLAISPDSSILAASSIGGVALWDTATGLQFLAATGGRSLGCYVF